MTARTVVAAPYPTMAGAEARATFAMVRALVDEGTDVTVVSPRPSAAHHHADPGSPRGALRLGRVVGADTRLVLRLDASGVAAHADPPAAMPGRLALAAVLRRAGDVELLLDRVPMSLSTRWAALIVSPASSVRVATDGERDALVRAGVDADRVAIDETLAPAAAVPVIADEGVRGAAGVTAEDIEAYVRARAAATRRAARDPSVASAPLRGVVPLERPTELSHKPGVATIKRLQLRLIGWMFDAVAGHVNRLQHATIESVDRAAGQRDDRADKRS